VNTTRELFFPKEKTFWLFFLLSFFVFFFWTFVPDWIQTTYEKTRVNFFKKIHKSKQDSLGVQEISEK